MKCSTVILFLFFSFTFFGQDVSPTQDSNDKTKGKKWFEKDSKPQLGGSLEVTLSNDFDLIGIIQASDSKYNLIAFNPIQSGYLYPGEVIEDVEILGMVNLCPSETTEQRGGIFGIGSKNVTIINNNYYTPVENMPVLRWKNGDQFKSEDIIGEEVPTKGSFAQFWQIESFIPRPEGNCDLPSTGSFAIKLKLNNETRKVLLKDKIASEKNLTLEFLQKSIDRRLKERYPNELGDIISEGIESNNFLSDAEKLQLTEFVMHFFNLTSLDQLKKVADKYMADGNFNQAKSSIRKVISNLEANPLNTTNYDIEIAKAYEELGDALILDNLGIDGDTLSDVVLAYQKSAAHYNKHGQLKRRINTLLKSAYVNQKLRLPKTLEQSISSLENLASELNHQTKIIDQELSPDKVKTISGNYQMGLTGKQGNLGVHKIVSDEIHILEGAVLLKPANVDKLEIKCEKLIVYRSTINGNGKNGDHGTPGNSVSGAAAYGRARANGGHGTYGGNGKNGLSIVIESKAIEFKGKITINIRGGNGGNGGSGGRGQKGFKGRCCGYNGSSGGRGGNGRNGGNGGNGGGLLIYTNTSKSQFNIVQYQGKGIGGARGNRGAGGLPGDGRQCDILCSDKRSGSSGPNGSYGTRGSDGIDGIFTVSQIQ